MNTVVHGPGKFLKALGLRYQGLSLRQKATLSRIPGFNVQLIQALQEILVHCFDGFRLQSAEQRNEIVDVRYVVLTFLQKGLQALFDALLGVKSNDVCELTIID